jgi:hypothetical protein
MFAVTLNYSSWTEEKARHTSEREGTQKEGSRWLPPFLGEPASSELFLSKEKYAKKRAPDFAGALSELI